MAKVGNPQVAVYAGTFDPLTNGHLDIIERAANLYEKVIVAVAVHGRKSRKKTVFSEDERMNAVKQATAHLPGVEVSGFSNLLYRFVEQNNAGVVIRGLRVTADFDFEFQLAAMNAELSDQFETVFLMARQQHTIISSTMVKEVAQLGGDVARYVPKSVQPMLEKLYDHVQS